MYRYQILKNCDQLPMDLLCIDKIAKNCDQLPKNLPCLEKTQQRWRLLLKFRPVS